MHCNNFLFITGNKREAFCVYLVTGLATATEPDRDRE